jgi:ATP-dependent DNA ligase
MRLRVLLSALYAMLFKHLFDANETYMVQSVIRNAEPRPRFIDPMECKRVSKLPKGDDWLHEIKQDGYRALALMDGDTGLLYSMSGLDCTEQFPHVAFALKNSKLENIVLDGEMSLWTNIGVPAFKNCRIARAHINRSSTTSLMCSIATERTCSINR